MKTPAIRINLDETTLGRRAKARARIGLPASIETLTGSRRVVLQNISVTGCMIEAPQLPSVGSDVIVKCGTIDAMAVVIWAGNGRCGLAFDDPADGREIMRLRTVAEEVGRSNRSIDEIEAAEDWKNGSLR